jgi:hypothetical protein
LGIEHDLADGNIWASAGKLQVPVRDKLQSLSTLFLLLTEKLKSRGGTIDDRLLMVAARLAELSVTALSLIDSESCLRRTHYSVKQLLLYFKLFLESTILQNEKD